MNKMSQELKENSPSTDDVSGIFIVIAAYNEEAAIGAVVRELVPRWPNVIVVDDGSSDGTAAEASKAGAVVLTHPINRGQGAALQTGIAYGLRAGARVIVTFDADGQHDPDDIDAMTRPILEGKAHITLGSRFLEKRDAIPAGRKLVLKAAVVFTRVTSGMVLTDTHNGFRALSREAAQMIDMRLDRMAHASEIIDQIKKTGLPYLEIPVHIRYTEYSIAKGQSSANAIRVAADYLVDKLLR